MKNKGMSPILVGAAGVAIGITATTLSQKENRKKITDSLEKAKKKVGEIADQIDKSSHDIRVGAKEMKRKIDEGTKRQNIRKKK